MLRYTRTNSLLFLPFLPQPFLSTSSIGPMIFAQVGAFLFFTASASRIIPHFHDALVESPIELGGNPTAVDSRSRRKRYLELPLQRHDSIPGLTKRAVNPATAVLEIVSDLAGYTASIEVGTPAQTLNLILDTGSPLTWLSSTNVSSYTPSGDSTGESTSALENEICASKGCFSSSDSSTFSTSPAQVFAIEYVDGSEAIGEITTDTVEFAGLPVAGFQFGLVTYLYNPDTSGAPAGIIGLSPQSALVGYPSLADAIGTQANETEVAFNGPTLLDQFVSAKVIDTDAFSLYLNNDGNGSLLLGGVDHAKYSGPLTVVPIADTSEQALQVTVTAVAFNGSSTSSSSSSVSLTDVVATLDSGTTEIYLPASVVELIASELGGSVNGGQPLVKCSALTTSTTIDFHFENNAVVRTPIELLVDLEGKVSGVEMCRIGVISTDSDSYYLLGDYFLRSAYVVYNWQESQIALAQVAYSTNTNISTISSGSYGIPGAIYNSSSPGASGTASVASVAGVESSLSSTTSTPSSAYRLLPLSGEVHLVILTLAAAFGIWLL